MFTAAATEQGNVVTNGLHVWFDFGNKQCFNPTLYTGSISANTLFYNLAPNQSHISGTINGAVNWSTAFGGCMNLTNANTSTLEYTAGLSASFTVQTIVTPGTDALPNNNWVSDGGGWPSARFGNGYIWAQQQTGGANTLLGILWAGGSPGTLASGTAQPISGYTEYMRFPNVYSFKTNASNSRSTYMNVGFKQTETTTRNRGNSSLGTISLNYDNAVGNRHGIGRIVAYLHYQRELEDWEIYQNAQYYLNRIGIK